MSTTTVELGPRSVAVDGHDISSACRRYTLTVDADGALPVLSVDLMVHEITWLAGEVEVVIPSETRAALEALGWTPPPEE